MSIAYRCGQCGKQYTLGDEVAGRRVKCKQCGTIARVPAATPPPQMDVYGLDDEPAPKASAAPAPSSFDEEELPPPPRAGMPPKPKTKAERKAFEKRVKARDRELPSFTQPLFGISFGAVLAVSLFMWKMYRAVVRPLRVLNRAVAEAPEDPAPRPARKVGPITPPKFPDAGAGVVLEPGVRLHEVRLGPPDVAPESPGHRGKLWLYLPDGKHPSKALSCVLIAGAGSNLITGMNLADADRAEHLPYVRAGFAVLAYELDGAEDESDDDADLETVSGAFLAAEAGLVNARNALNFLALKVPEVDPARVYAVGHSSAGTLALLLAENETRIKGCVAFAPATDTARRFPPQLQEMLTRTIPGADAFFSRFNPILHADSVSCPVFLFHAQDDSNVPVGQSQEFKARLEQLGKPVTLETVPTGDHYDAMIQQGIPRAIAWLQGLAGGR
jgi:dienelactone hydrolase